MEFSYTAPIKYGWETFKNNWKFLVPLFLVYLALTWIPSFVIERISKESKSLGSLLSIASNLFSLFLTIGFIRIGLALIDGKKPGIKDLFSGSNLFVPYFLASLLYMLIVGGGMILLIVPGVYWAVKYGFYTEIIVDKGITGWAAFKKSAEITNGYKVKILVFTLLISLLNLAGMLALGVGLFVTMIISYIASLKLYRDLLAESERKAFSAVPAMPLDQEKPVFQADAASQ